MEYLLCTEYLVLVLLGVSFHEPPQPTDSPGDRLALDQERLAKASSDYLALRRISPFLDCKQTRKADAKWSHSTSVVPCAILRNRGHAGIDGGISQG